ncbi:MAG: hypothetical protein SFX72_04525 [Isosphaeraceae bacterium]|nr:hypothetical protein [Isosphaeraceae bacterium]
MFRSLASALLATLALATTVAAQTRAEPARTRPAPARAAATEPRHVVDVRDFGAIPDGKTDSADAFQRAVDTLARTLAADTAPGDRAVGIVRVPAAPRAYKLGKPVWLDQPFIEIRGEGQGTRVETFPQRNHPLFLLGLRRVARVELDGKQQLLEPSPRYRPDLFGRLDAAAVPKRGLRGGFRTHGETLIQAQASPLSDGPRHSRGDWTTDHWYETRALTVELAIEGPGGGPMPAGTAIFSIGVGSDTRAYPLLMYTDGDNRWLVKFSTQRERFGPLVSRRFGFSTGRASGIQRIAFQIDLERAEVAAFADGRELDLERGLGDDFAPGLRFAENDYYPLLIADGGGNRPALGNRHGKDWTLAGFLFSRTPRYRVGRRPGSAQTRNDGKPIDDLYRYFTPPEADPGTIGFFDFLDRPDEHGRMLTIQGGPAANGHRAAAFLIHCLQNKPGGILDNAVRDIHLVGGKLYGQNLAVGQVLDLRISGVRSTDAYHAVGSLNNGANYTIRLDDCTFDASDSGYFGLDQLIWARNIHFAGSGRATIRLVGCSASFENVFVGFHSPNNESTAKLHAGDYGGNYAFRNVQVDYEGDAFLHAPFYAEIHPYIPETTLRLTDVFLGTVGKQIPLVLLREGEPGWKKTGYLSVDVMQAFQPVETIVETDGPGWRGTLRGVAAGSRAIIRKGSSVEPAARIRVEP